MKTKLIAVIHYQDDEQAIRNADRVAAAGLDGVFLIEMSGINTRLVPMALKIKDKHPGMLVGVNHLTLDPRNSLQINLSANLDMTWTDFQPTHSETERPDIAWDLSRTLEGTKHDLFVGVAFKHQRDEPDPVAAASRAISAGFVPTTSGPATGVAADIERICELRAGIGQEADLAIASGITPENASQFAPHLSHILVATGISSSFHELDATLMANLRSAVPLG